MQSRGWSDASPQPPTEPVRPANLYISELDFQAFDDLDSSADHSDLDGIVSDGCNDIAESIDSIFNKNVDESVPEEFKGPMSDSLSYNYRNLGKEAGYHSSEFDYSRREFCRSPSIDLPKPSKQSVRSPQAHDVAQKEVRYRPPTPKPEPVYPLPHDSVIINELVPAIKREHKKYMLLSSKSFRRLLPKERTKYIKQLAKTYIDAATHGLQLKNSLGQRVNCPAMVVLHDAIHCTHRNTYVVCRKPNTQVKEFHNLQRIKANGSLWRLVVQQQKFKLEPVHPTLEYSGICSVTAVRGQEDCSASNWNSFSIVRVDKKGRVVYILKFDELRVVSDLYEFNKHEAASY